MQSSIGLRRSRFRGDDFIPEEINEKPTVIYRYKLLLNTQNKATIIQLTFQVNFHFTSYLLHTTHEVPLEMRDYSHE